MAEIKGKFITLAASLMNVYPTAREKADQQLHAAVGKHWSELDPEGWYDTRLWDGFMKTYVQASASKDNALVTLGRQIYPTVKRTTGFPSRLKTPLDYIKFEFENYLSDHRGADVRPRRLISAREGDVVVEAPAPGYNSKLYVGVFLGILEMIGVRTGQVTQTKSQEQGDPTSEFHITW